MSQTGNREKDQLMGEGGRTDSKNRTVHRRVGKKEKKCLQKSTWGLGKLGKGRRKEQFSEKGGISNETRGKIRKNHISLRKTEGQSRGRKRGKKSAGLKETFR